MVEMVIGGMGCCGEELGCTRTSVLNEGCILGAGFGRDVRGAVAWEARSRCHAGFGEVHLTRFCGSDLVNFFQRVSDKYIIRN